MGASGYGGGELIRLLSGHPSVEAVAGASRRNAGKPVHSVHPNLRRLVNSTFVEHIDWDWLEAGETPVLFSAMPHGELAKQVGELSPRWSPRLTVIDLSADFRLGCPELYKRYYGEIHPHPEALAEWTYGLCEWKADEIRGATRIANPGCFASALELGLFPLLTTSEIEFVAASGVTGSSGSGMAPSDTTHHPTRSNDFRAYKVLAHQHLGEVEQLLATHGRQDLEVSFVPHSAPMVRGILVTLQFRVPESLSVRQLFEKAYAGRPFVRLLEGSPRVAAVAGSNFVDIGIVQRGRQAAVLVALDNLLKGMSGQAVQNMNLALGRPETEGLWFSGGFPY